MIEGTIYGRRFSLDFSGKTVKADFEDDRDKDVIMQFETFCYHSEKGPGFYSLKNSLVDAQACIDALISMGLQIVITKGFADPHDDIVFE